MDSVRFYLGLAKQAIAISCDPIPSRLQWLFTPSGYKFFINHNVSFDVKSTNLPFTQFGNKADPMAYVMKVSN